jgi:dihydroflavonol-4-reductase
MRIFVTGGTGFIGSHVVTRLADRGHVLHCLARPSSSTQLLERIGAIIITGDLTDRGSLKGGMAGCDWVINVAGTYEFWVPDRRVFQRVNVEGTRNVMECALEEGVAKVVHVSTGGVWGRPTKAAVTESTPFGPQRFSEYFETKYQGELIAWELFETRGLPLVVVYPGAVLGRGDPKASGEYIRRLVQHRLPATVFDRASFPFVHVEDVAEAIVRAAEKPDNIGARYIVAKHNPTFAELNALVSEESGTPLPKMHLPDWATMFAARLFSGVADVTKRPPLMGMAFEQMWTMKEGLVLDGSKAETELGLAYTPLRTCVRDAVSVLQTRH